MIQRPLWLAVAAVAIVAAAVPVALVRHEGHGQAINVAPLSVTDRRALAADADLVTSLPGALAEVPSAASDAASHRVSPSAAAALIHHTNALQPLADAIGNPIAASAALTASFRAVVVGRPVPDPAAVEDDINAMQTIEGDIVPAVRLVAVRTGRHLDAAAALSLIEADPRTPQLARLLSSWQQLYGAFLLVGQAAA